MATEETSKQQTQPSTNTKRSEPLPENVYRGLSLREFVSELKKKGMNLKDAKFKVTVLD